MRDQVHMVGSFACSRLNRFSSSVARRWDAGSGTILMESWEQKEWDHLAIGAVIGRLHERQSNLERNPRIGDRVCNRGAGYVASNDWPDVYSLPI
jgi:hypothetical protein